MDKIKTGVASGLTAMVLLAGLGLSVMMLGFAVILGGVLALALRLGAGVSFEQSNPPRMNDDTPVQGRDTHGQAAPV
nr:hypothetical protein [Amylibacter sp.]